MSPSRQCPLDQDLYELLPHDHRQSYDMRACSGVHSRWREASTSSRPNHAREMICGHGHIEGLAGRGDRQRRGMFKDPQEGASAVRRDRLHGERREGGLLHRDHEPAADPDPVRAGCVRLHGRARRRSTRGSSGPGPNSSRRWRRPPCPRSS